MCFCLYLFLKFYCRFTWGGLTWGHTRQEKSQKMNLLFWPLRRPNYAAQWSAREREMVCQVCTRSSVFKCSNSFAMSKCIWLRFVTFMVLLSVLGNSMKIWLNYYISKVICTYISLPSWIQRSVLIFLVKYSVWAIWLWNTFISSSETLHNGMAFTETVQLVWWRLKLSMWRM